MTQPGQPGWAQAPDGSWHPVGPPPKKQTNPWTIVGWVVVILVFVPCVGCSAIAGVTLLGKSATTTTTAVAGGGTPTTKPAPSAQSPTTVAGPGSSKDAPAPVGTAVSPAKDWEVSVVSSVADANAIAASMNTFNRPKAGNQFMQVTVKVKNNSAKPDSVGGNVEIKLLPTNGVAIRDGFVAGDPTNLSPATQLQPGAEATGTLWFEVPAALVPGSVLLAEPTFTLDPGKDQRFLALS